jgi:ABC-2 type transport system ATP-binding protein
MAILTVEHINKTYGDFKAVSDISFEVKPGQMYGVLGPNGAGKTTTIRMIMNILVPDSGSIRLFDQEMNEDLKARIGYLPEERGLYPKMTVQEMLVFLGELHGLSPQDARRKGLLWLEKLEMSDRAANKVEELSKGLQQKIQFIGTVMHEPELVILDEPFSGLDPVNVQVLKDIMMELKEEGKAIMFSTHVMEAAEKLCDEILLINKGQKILDGEIHKIKQQYANNAVQIVYDGKGDFIRDLPQVEKMDDYGNYVEVLLKDGVDGHDLLELLISKIRIKSFTATQSSLNDIFISMVGGNGHE